VISQNYIAQNFEAALVNYLKFREKNGYVVQQVILKNYQRYAKIIGLLNGKQHNIFIIFKREPYYTFGKKFAHEGESGAGESINSRYLRECLKEVNQIKEINVVYSIGHYYTIKPEIFALKGYKHELGFEKKEVYSVNLNYLERLV
jgi:hypothetical protein